MTQIDFCIASNRPNSKVMVIKKKKGKKIGMWDLMAFSSIENEVDLESNVHPKCQHGSCMEELILLLDLGFRICSSLGLRHCGYEFLY